MCYDMQGKKELLHAINIFLDDVSDTVDGHTSRSTLLLKVVNKYNKWF